MGPTIQRDERPPLGQRAEHFENPSHESKHLSLACQHSSKALKSQDEKKPFCSKEQPGQVIVTSTITTTTTTFNCPH
ncbi:hypothetical protein TYRP_003531 [Tyrophagus putrescentiae]|nr:hypothetical protein TYRP_003531 [Tyrophagus putrescentiae]